VRAADDRLARLSYGWTPDGPTTPLDDAANSDPGDHAAGSVSGDDLVARLLLVLRDQPLDRQIVLTR
jgi:hypothetical protein